MLSTFGLQKIIIRAAIVNITISIVFGMERRANFPSTIHPGRSASNEPRSTTRKVPTRKRITDNFAPFTPTNSFSLQAGIIPSFNRFKYSGSSFNSFPILLATNAANIQAMKVEGILTFKISNKVIL